MHFLITERQGVIPTPAGAIARQTTGVGDVFTSGCFVARKQGWSVEQAIGLGRQVSVQVLQHFGAHAPKDAAHAQVDFLP